MSRKILILLLVATMPLTVFGKTVATCKGVSVGGPSAHWVLREGPVHPRSAAMAHATTALKGASETMFDNPANMAMMDRSYDVTLAHREWIADILFYQGSIALRPAGGRYGTFGLTFWRKDYGRSEPFTIVIPENDSVYSFIKVSSYRLYHQTIGLGYALSPIPSLSIGMHLKHLTDYTYPEELGRVNTI